MSDKQNAIQIVVRSSDSSRGRNTGITVNGSSVNVRSSAAVPSREHAVPAGAVTGWTYCGFHNCSCSLPKVCLLTDDHCNLQPVCVYSAHDCERPKVCTNPACRCGKPKMVDEHHGSAM